MLEIKIGDEYLDLLPGTQLEIEQENPYVQFDDKVVGEFSLPFQVPSTPKNIRLLKYAAMINKRIDNTGIDAIVYDNGVQHSIGKIKIEKANIHLNKGDKGSVSCYYLTGISRFYQEVKGKRLKKVNFGGSRTFAWDNFNRFGGGFWGHIHKVIDAPAGYGSSGYDYAFYPAINNDFTWQLKTKTLGGGAMNNMSFINGSIVFTQQGISKSNDANTIVPFPYLKYVIDKIAEYIGWKIEGSILSDPDFLKITLWNSRAIDWVYYPKSLVFDNFIALPLPSISFDLSDHLPDIGISEFLLALRNRFGWYYEVDRKGKILRIKEIQKITGSTVKDFTAVASPLVPKNMRTEKKIYSLKTNEDSGAINLSGFSDEGTVATRANLPAASQARYLQAYLVVTENNYYTCQQNENTNAWEWQLYDYNVRDVVPEGSTEDVITAALTTSNEYYSPYLDFIPRYDEAGYWPGRSDDTGNITLLLLFYHGIRNNKAGQPYPYASSHIYDSQGQQVANWSLSFLGKKIDGTDIGIYHRNYKKFLDTLSASEEFEVTLHLPLLHYLNLTFNDIISVNNVRMYAAKFKTRLPYRQELTAECSRVG
jgi:hypothetical protein